MTKENYITNLPEDLQCMIQWFVHKSQMCIIKKEIIKSPLVLDKRFQEDCETRDRVTRWLDSLSEPMISPLDEEGVEILYKISPYTANRYTFTSDVPVSYVVSMLKLESDKSTASLIQDLFDSHY